MEAEAWLKTATRKLETAGISTARLDCLVLLEDCLNKNRTHILANPHLLINGEQLDLLNSRAERRATHEPLAYIRGKSEFYGRSFFVDKRVLEPRPESETIIALLKKNTSAQKSDLRVVDVGTGSGALAITAKLEIPNAEVTAIDIDDNCLDVARQNTETLKTSIEFLQGNLLDALENSTPDSKPSSLILLCNLPYVPNDFHINAAAEAEPRLAIFGGKDGLDLYRRLFKQIRRLQRRPDVIFTEALPPQHSSLAEIAGASHYHLVQTDDFIQQFEQK